MAEKRWLMRGRLLTAAGALVMVAGVAATVATPAFGAFPGTDGVLGFASTGDLGNVPVGANGGNQIVYQATPVGSPPASFTNVQNVTTVGGGTDASPFYSADGSFVY